MPVIHLKIVIYDKGNKSAFLKGFRNGLCFVVVHFVNDFLLFHSIPPVFGYHGYVKCALCGHITLTFSEMGCIMKK